MKKKFKFYEKHLKVKEANFAQYAKTVAQKEGIRLGRNVESDLRSYAQFKYEDARTALSQKVGHVQKLRYKYFADQGRLEEVGDRIIDVLTALKPPSIPIDLRDQMILQYASLEHELAKMRTQAAKDFENNMAFKAEMGALVNGYCTHEQAYFVAKAARVINMNFLRMASQLTAGDDPAITDEDILFLRNQTEQKVSEIQRHLERKGLKIDRSHLNKLTLKQAYEAFYTPIQSSAEKSDHPRLARECFEQAMGITTQMRTRSNSRLSERDSIDGVSNITDADSRRLIWV